MSHNEHPTPQPQPQYDVLDREFGPFGLDAAATASNAKCPVFYTKEDDGLSRPWMRLTWCNPPYSPAGTVGKWVAKAMDEVGAGNAELVVMLVPASTDAQWYRDAKAAEALIRFVPGRVWKRAERGSLILVLGKLAGRHGTEPAWCTVCGELFWPAYPCRKTCSERCRRRSTAPRCPKLAIGIGTPDKQPGASSCVQSADR